MTDRKPEPCALQYAALMIQLPEGQKDLFELVRGDPEARILDLKSQVSLTPGQLLPLCPKHDAPTRGEFYGVAQQIKGDLTQLPGIRLYRLRNLGCHHIPERETRLFRTHTRKVRDVDQKLRQTELTRSHLVPSGLNLCKVQDIVDQRE